MFGLPPVRDCLLGSRMLIRLPSTDYLQNLNLNSVSKLAFPSALASTNQNALVKLLHSLLCGLSIISLLKKLRNISVLRSKRAIRLIRGCRCSLICKQLWLWDRLRHKIGEQPIDKHEIPFKFVFGFTWKVNLNVLYETVN